WKKRSAELREPSTKKKATRASTMPATTFVSIAAANSPLLARQLPRKCLPTRTQKRPVHHQAPASLIPSILHMNTVNTRGTATRSMNMESIFAFGGSNQTALGKSCSIFKRARRHRNDVLMRNEGRRLWGAEL